jgi:hypothetical protein
MQNARIAVDTLDPLRRTKHGEGGGASEEGSGKETVVEGRHSASEEHGPQRTRRENRESSQANRRRNASKGEDRTHLDQHDTQEASIGKEALRRKGEAAGAYSDQRPCPL